MILLEMKDLWELNGQNRCILQMLIFVYMKEIKELTAIIEREGDGYVALCPEFDVASQGDSIEEARANLIEALELFYETASPEEIDRRFHDEVFNPA